MIVNKYTKGGGGSGSGMTPEQVEQQINSALTPYWDSGETKDYVDEAVSGISLEGYYTSAQTEERIASAYTILDEHITEVEQVTASALTELHDDIIELSARTIPDMSLYTPTSGFSTINGSAITNGGDIVIEGGGSTEDIELPIAAAVNDLKGNIEARLDQQYYKKQEVLNLLQDKLTTAQVSQQIVDEITPLFEAVYDAIENKELAISAAINDLNTRINNL